MRETNGNDRWKARTARIRPAVVTMSAACLVATAFAPALAEDPAAPVTPPPFEAGDISIGEPIALPFTPPAEVAAPAAQAPQSPATAPAAPAAATSAAPIASPQATIQPPAATASGAALPPVPGNGWLGIVVAESAQPGRWMVAEVAEGGPAATAGILAGDEVRAINGQPLTSGDEVAEVLTTIAAGQEVRLAVARGEQVGDVAILATPRPAAPRPTVPDPVARPAAPQPPAVSSWAAAADPQARPFRDAVPPSTPAAAADLPAPAFATPAPSPRSRFANPRAGAIVGEPAPPPAANQPDLPATGGGGESGRGRTALGVRTVPIDPGIQERFRLPEASGAYVIGVVGDLPASKAGVPPGSVIVALGDRPVRSPAELTRLVTSGPVGRPVSLHYVLPGGTSRSADVVLQTLEQPLEAALVGPSEPTPVAVPSLQPQPAATVAQRPISASPAATIDALHTELLRLRARVESLERQLEAGRR